MRRNIDHPKASIERSPEQRHGDVVDRHPAAGAPLECTVVGVAVEDGLRAESVDGHGQPAGAEERRMSGGSPSLVALTGA